MTKSPSFWKKHFVPRSLFGRSLMILIIPILLILIITTIVFFDRHWSKMTNRLAFAVSGEIAVMADAIERDPTPETVERITAYAARGLELLISYDPDQRTLEETGTAHFGLWEYLVAETLARQLEENVRRPFTVDADFQEKWVEVTVLLEDGVMRISLPERRLFSSSGYIFILWMYFIAFVLLLVAVLFMRNQVRPIRRLAVAADRFGKGRDTPDFKPEGSKEVRQAAEAFIKMRTRIKRQIEQRTIMLAGVSHDLRTPLTRLKLQLAMMGDNDDIVQMKADITDMERMITGYLDFVRGDTEEEAVSTSIKELLERAAETARSLGREVVIDMKEQIALPVRPLSLQRAFDNVIGNAARYGNHIKITAKQDEDGERIFVTVEDDGPGIDESRYDDVFKPFTRIEESRNPETGGVGLGLPIAMDVIHGHGGKIHLEKSEGLGGLKVVMTLPV